MSCVLGALYPDGTSGAKKQDDGIPPGGNHTYKWTVKPELAPAQGDPNCLTWAYHSHVMANRDISSGLIGGLLTCKKGKTVSQQTIESLFITCTHSFHSLAVYVRTCQEGNISACEGLLCVCFDNLVF